ncbi:MAG: hypothetical protein QOF97_2681, partial [Acidimicrobiaceae bacterium]
MTDLDSSIDPSVAAKDTGIALRGLRKEFKVGRNP